MHTLLILLPGNPAIPGIYDTFTAACREQLPGLETTVLAHRGQSDESSAAESEHCLERVLEEHENSIVALITARRPQRVCLVGHSLGTAVAVALYDALASHIDRLVLICPFLQPRGRNRLLLWLMSNERFNRSFRGALRGFLGLKRAALPLMRGCFKLGASTERVRNALIRDHFLDNFIGLTSDYLRFFRQHRPLDALNRLPLQHTLFISAPCDFWVPDALLDDLPSGACRILSMVSACTRRSAMPLPRRAPLSCSHGITAESAHLERMTIGVDDRRTAWRDNNCRAQG